MKKKLVWVALSSLMVGLLLLASGGTAEAEAKQQMVKDAFGKLVEKPQYGGTVTFATDGSNSGFDETNSFPWASWVNSQVYELAFEGDITRGSRRTNEASWRSGAYWPVNPITGSAVQSWEWRNQDRTMVFHVRKGVHFHNKPPTNGREMTADDVAFSLQRVFDSPKAYVHMVTTPPTSIKAVDKWTVEIVIPKEGTKSPPLQIFPRIMEYISIVPRDAVEKYGDLSDWRNACGTSAWVLTDYVEGSSASFERHPNYWRNDPFHPENQLPYPDKLEVVVITDKSTRLAAFRTGKIDNFFTANWEDRDLLMKSNPQAKYIKYPFEYSWQATMRTDTPPFDDIRVRRAMAMAVDNRAILKDFYNGNGEILTTPFSSRPEHAKLYIPPEKLSKTAQKLYGYYPEEAKKLLAEAGYPKGFKTTMLVPQGHEQPASILQAYWEMIGVKVKQDVREVGAYQSVCAAKKHPPLAYRFWAPNSPYRHDPLKANGPENTMMVNDPIVSKAVEEAWTFEMYLNEDQSPRAAVLGKATQHIIEEAWWVQFPTPYSYVMWHPWLKGYAGEFSVGTSNLLYNFAKYVWIDQKLKKSK